MATASEDRQQTLPHYSPPPRQLFHTSHYCIVFCASQRTHRRPWKRLISPSTMGESRYARRRGSGSARQLFRHHHNPRGHMLMRQPCRQELVAWLNNLLQLNITKVEQCGTGYVILPAVSRDKPSGLYNGNANTAAQSGIMSSIRQHFL